MDPKDFLASHDIAPTALRVQIVQILSEKKCPVSYDELVEQTGANKTTIYRNIALLEEKNLIITSENNHKSFYELTDGAKAYFDASFATKKCQKRACARIVREVRRLRREI